MEDGTPTTAPAAAPAQEAGHPDGPRATLLVDAANGFGNMSRLAALWTVAHRWSKAARFFFNTYRHWNKIMVRRPGGEPEYYYSKEGVVQGDPLAMMIYAVTLLPLAERIRADVREVVQPFYADDLALYGRARFIAKAMALVVRLGPSVGYFPEPDKSGCICTRAEEEEI